jgi:hypothetical protein
MRTPCLYAKPARYHDGSQRVMTEHEAATLETVAGLLSEILQELERVRGSVARVAEGLEMLTERLDGLTKRMQAEMGADATRRSR